MLSRTRYAEIIGPAVAGDARAQHELFQAHRPLVYSIVRQYAGRGGADLEDLIQEGNLALVYALARFDPERGVSFGTYAAWWVRAAAQAVTRHPLVGRLTTRSDKRIAPRLGAARRKLTLELGRSPTNAELAEELGATREELDELFLKMTPTVTLAEDKEEGGAHVPASPCLDPEREAYVRSTLDAVRRVVEEELDERSRTMFLRHVIGEERLESIAVDYGLSRERVRQIVARAREHVLDRVESPALAG